jgi:hypothetical protein
VAFGLAAVALFYVVLFGHYRPESRSPQTAAYSNVNSPTTASVSSTAFAHATSNATRATPTSAVAQPTRTGPLTTLQAYGSDDCRLVFRVPSNYHVDVEAVSGMPNGHSIWITPVRFHDDQDAETMILCSEHDFAYPEETSALKADTRVTLEEMAEDFDGWQALTRATVTNGTNDVRAHITGTGAADIGYGERKYYLNAGLIVSPTNVYFVVVYGSTENPQVVDAHYDSLQASLVTDPT